MYPYLTIFLEGKHSTAHSKKLWSEADIDAVLESSLKNSEEKIPFTAQTDEGKHPKGNLPVFGYADKTTLRKVAVNGKAALQIQPCDFAEGLLNKLKDTPLNKMSVRFDGADFSLEHICFVERPAVKEVPPLSTYDFSDDSQKWIDLSADADFADTRMYTVGSMLRNMRDWAIGKFGLDEANKMLPDSGLDLLKDDRPEIPTWYNDWTERLAKRIAALEERVGLAKKTMIIDQEDTPYFNFNADEEKMKEELEKVLAAQAKTSADFAAFQENAAKNEAAIKASTEAFKAENAALQKQIAEMREATTHRDNADFVDALVAKGQVLPVERDLAVADLNFAAKSEEKINFSGAEKSMLEHKKEMLSQRPVIAPLGGHIATKDRAFGGNADFSFDNPEGRGNLAKAANKLSKEKNISFAEAVAELASQEEASA